MSILTYDTSARIADDNTGASGSASFTIGNNTNRILVVLASITIGGNYSDSTFTATYNGVSLTSYREIAVNPGAGTRYKTVCFYLVAPAIGSNTLAWTSSHSTYDTVSVFAYSFYNANQSTPFNTYDTFVSPDDTTLITTNTDKCIPMAIILQDGSGVALTNIANNSLSDTGTTAKCGWADAVTPAGNHSCVGGSGNWAGLQVALNPFLVVNTLTAGQGSFTITWRTFLRYVTHTFIASLGTFSYTLKNVATTLTRKWINESKNTSSETLGTKHTSSWVDEGENSSNFTNQNKS